MSVVAFPSPSLYHHLLPCIITFFVPSLVFGLALLPSRPEASCGLHKKRWSSLSCQRVQGEPDVPAPDLPRSAKNTEPELQENFSPGEDFFRKLNGGVVYVGAQRGAEAAADKKEALFLRGGLNLALRVFVTVATPLFLKKR